MDLNNSIIKKVITKTTFPYNGEMAELIILETLEGKLMGIFFPEIKSYNLQIGIDSSADLFSSSRLTKGVTISSQGTTGMTGIIYYIIDLDLKETVDSKNKKELKRFLV